MAWDDAAERGAGCEGTGEIGGGVEAEEDILEELVFHNDDYEGTPLHPHLQKPRARVCTGVFDCPTHWHVLDSRHGRLLFLAEARDAPLVLILWESYSLNKKE
jgi:hypothetical protein